MPDVTDMRGYVQLLEEMGELRKLDGADLICEVGALTERAAEKQGPALLFDRFQKLSRGLSRNFQRISHLQAHRAGDGHRP